MAKVPKKAARRNNTEERLVKQLDALAEFEEFKAQILPGLKKDLAAGLSAEEIMKKYASLAAARTVSIALTEADSSKAQSAVRDILDRSQGKATERKEIKHTLAETSDDELDAVLLSKLQKVEESDEDDLH